MDDCIRMLLWKVAVEAGMNSPGMTPHKFFRQFQRRMVRYEAGPCATINHVIWGQCLCNLSWSIRDIYVSLLSNAEGFQSVIFGDLSGLHCVPLESNVACAREWSQHGLKNVMYLQSDQSWKLPSERRCGCCGRGEGDSHWKTCSRCRVTVYCCEGCQHFPWLVHRDFCNWHFAQRAEGKLTRRRQQPNLPAGFRLSLGG